MDCNNYRGILRLSTSYKILSNTLLSRTTPYAKGIIGEYQCGFRRNRSTIDHIFSIRRILEKKWKYNNEVCQLFIDFEKDCDSIKRESLYDILIKFGVPRKLVRLIKTCLDGTQSKVRIGNYLSSSFPIETI
jgi:Reverse transcriptase (RNA-dependent DNA polymerase).